MNVLFVNDNSEIMNYLIKNFTCENSIIVNSYEMTLEELDTVLFNKLFGSKPYNIDIIISNGFDIVVSSVAYKGVYNFVIDPVLSNAETNLINKFNWIADETTYDDVTIFKFSNDYIMDSNLLSKYFKTTDIKTITKSNAINILLSVYKKGQN